MSLVIVENGPQKGTRYSLKKPGPFILGREINCTAPINDRMVSRHHCRIEDRNGVYFLVDLQSANGTFLNGSRILEQSLVGGDRIQIGETTFTFFPEGERDPLIGKIISGFQMLERVGQGGMGTVYKARQISLDRMVALKVLSKNFATDRNFAELFHREARAAGQINHPSIVQVYDVDTVQVENDEVTFFAMEFMPGGSVEDLLNREKTLPVERALEIALDTARGIQFAEKRGLVHRDIKPGNLMIGETGMVKIGDLGIARWAKGGDKVSQKDGISGSPHYISPEQARGNDLDSGADMYSLGVTLYHLLAGKPPFVGPSAREVVLKHLRDEPPPMIEFRTDVPPPVTALIQRMMEKDRENRYPNAEALVTALESTLQEIRQPYNKQRILARKLKRAAPAIGILVLLVTLGASGGIFVHGYLKRKADEETKINKRIDSVENALVEAHLDLEAGKLEQTKKALKELRESIRGDSAIEKRYPDAFSELAILERKLEEKFETARETERRNLAEARLNEVLAAKPRDPLSVHDIPILKKFLDSLDEVAQDFHGTPAAVRAESETERVRDAVRSLERLLQRARDAYASLESKVKTFLDFEPPNYKRALEQLRSYPDEFAETQWESKRKERIREVTRAMEADALRWVEEAVQKVREGRLSQAIRGLERLRAEVEGVALETIDKALEGLKE